MITRIEVEETNRMIQESKLDIRTITLGISLLDCAAGDLETLNRRIYDKIMRKASGLVRVGKELSAEYGIPIINERISVTPIALVAGGSGASSYLSVAQTLDRAARETGVHFIGGFSAQVQKGFSIPDSVLFDSIPEALASTERVCSSVNLGTTRDGINMTAVYQIGKIIQDLAQRTRDRGAIGCAKFVVFCNAPDDNPFMAGAFHGVGCQDCAVHVGISGPGVIKKALETVRESDFETLCETIKRMAFKITRAGQLVALEASRRLGVPFGIIDLSLAPTPARGDSVAEILETMGLEHAGAPGSTAALAILTDNVKKGGVMASSCVGGLSGAFIPVSEDRGMIEAVRVGCLTLEKLEAMTAVCSVGLDMIAIPGDTSPETIAGVIADEMAIGMMNGKTTAVRIIPVPGKTVGDSVDYGGLLGSAPVMPVNRFRCDAFVKRGGRIPPPIHSFRN